ncbi:PERK3 [Symbiodinium sp. CCMP2592]|nr:PERK3 [Symbiodinium sp. CCMP2592]
MTLNVSSRRSAPADCEPYEGHPGLRCGVDISLLPWLSVSSVSSWFASAKPAGVLLSSLALDPTLTLPILAGLGLVGASFFALNQVAAENDDSAQASPIKRKLDVTQQRCSKRQKAIILLDELGQLTMIGSGACGMLQRGVLCGREVAVKRLRETDEKSLQELQREVAALRCLQHSCVVAFVGECRYGVITELMPKGSLSHHLHEAKTFMRLMLRAKIAEQVCAGVEYLHSHSPRIVHGDLKPANVVLDNMYNAKLCDFGTSQFMVDDFIEPCGGTLPYLAPESAPVFRGETVKVTEKADVWSLGCVLNEALGGPRPHAECRNPEQLIAKVVERRLPPRLPEFLPARTVVCQCLIVDALSRAGARTVLSGIRRWDFTGDGARALRRGARQPGRSR